MDAVRMLVPPSAILVGDAEALRLLTGELVAAGATEALPKILPK